GPGAPVRAFNHYLGESSVTLFGTASLVEACTGSFPACLDDAPLLLPTSNTTLRRVLDGWFEKHSIRPRLVGEFEDSALLKAFGERGKGLFFAPSIATESIVSQYGVRAVAEIEEVTEQFYAISVQKRLRNPAAIAIRDNARARLGLVT
ncbi:MAG: hypothetical protein KDA28_09695, partial [Phycisphaerales bacterium]|nr:hypothetical protein [Phycisphaerales bacterium]